jgi:WD40 repeat protein
MATGKERGNIRVPTDMTPPHLRVWRGNIQGLSALAFSADGKFLAIGAGDRAIHIWNMSSDSELPPLIGHSGAIRALVFTPDGKRLVSFDQDGLKSVWSVTAFEKTAPARLASLSDRDFEELWTNLVEGDAFQTFRAVRHMQTDPRRALALLRQHVQPVPTGDTQRIGQLVADLQSPDAGLRRKAMAEIR